MTPCIDTLYMSSPAEPTKLQGMRVLIRVKLSETSTERIYKEKLVTGLLPSKEGVQLRNTQRASTSRVLTLAGESGRSVKENDTLSHLVIVYTLLLLHMGACHADSKLSTHLR